MDLRGRPGRREHVLVVDVQPVVPDLGLNVVPQPEIERDVGPGLPLVLHVHRVQPSELRDRIGQRERRIDGVGAVTEHAGLENLFHPLQIPVQSSLNLSPEAVVGLPLNFPQLFDTARVV